MSDFNLIDIINLIRAEIRKTQIGPIKKVTGPQGPQGIQGESGTVGPEGPRGNDGKPGPIGPKGNQGRKGDKGAKGEDGEDGVGIARIEQDIDNAIIVILTDGNAYTIEMPIVKGDGNPAEVHYKVAGGGTTQINGGGGGDVDLSGYVKVPEGFGDKWLVYNEATSSWAVATTDLIATNSAEVFRDSNGRFKSTENIPNLDNQLEVNRFIGVELEALNASDEAQWHEINDIKVELEALAPTRELGHWTISLAIPEEPEIGMVNFDPLDLSAESADMYIHAIDSDNKRHSFTTLETGDYIEAVGNSGFGLWITTAEVADHNGQADIKAFKLALVKSEGVLAVGDKVDIKAFHLADTEIDLAELDARYALKSHNHSGAHITSGTVSINRLPVGTSSSTVARGDHTHSDGGFVKVSHGYKTSYDSNQGASGSGKWMARMRSYTDGHLSNSATYDSFKRLGEIKFRGNDSKLIGKCGQVGTLVASTTSDSSAYVYLVFQIYKHTSGYTSGVYWDTFTGVITWMREKDRPENDYTTLGNAQDVYWTWHGEGT